MQKEGDDIHGKNLRELRGSLITADQRVGLSQSVSVAVAFE